MNANQRGVVTVQHLQSIVERNKTALARELHDVMGGYLIASGMDVTILRHRFASHDEDMRTAFCYTRTDALNCNDQQGKICAELIAVPCAAQLLDPSCTS